MVSINKIFLFVEKCCNKGAGFSRATGLKRVFPKINNAFVSVSSKIKNGKICARNATAQSVFGKDTEIYLYEKFAGKIKTSGAVIFTNLLKDRDFMGMVARFCLTSRKRMPIPKNFTELFQLLIEQSTGLTKLAQIVSDNKTLMSKLPFASLREAAANSKSNCFFTRSVKEAQSLLSQAFFKKPYKIIKELSSASISDVYLISDNEGSYKILKMLKKGLSRERLELEEKIYLRVAKEFASTPTEYKKFKDIINGCYSEFIGALSFTNEKLNNEILAKGAKRYRVAQILEVSQDGSCLIMNKAEGIRMDKLLKILYAYKQMPKYFNLRYADEIAKNPWLANPQRVISKLPDTIIRTFDEQYMFMKKGGKSVMHGDPHSGNFFISADKKGCLIPEFIDTGSCVVRTSKEILENVKFFTDYCLGNTKEIVLYYMKKSNYQGKNKKKFLQKVSKELYDKVFNKKKITDIKTVLANIDTVLNGYGLSLPIENINALKAQLQFYSVASEAAHLSGKPLNPLIIIKDLPKAVFKMFLYGKNPIPAIIQAIKHCCKNIENVVGATFQFTQNR